MTRVPAEPPAAPAKPRKPAVKGRRKARSALPAADAVAFIRALSQANPAPRSELAYQDPFTLLVAVVLSAQATDAGVNKATPALFAAAPDPTAMAALGAAEIGRHIRTIGLWQAKARHVAALSRALVDQHGGQVPQDRDAHHWLILHGRYVCRARAPECWRCVAKPWCRYPDKETAAPTK
jgi:endonuclease-3